MGTPSQVEPQAAPASAVQSAEPVSGAAFLTQMLDNMAGGQPTAAPEQPVVQPVGGTTPPPVQPSVAPAQPSLQPTAPVTPPPQPQSPVPPPAPVTPPAPTDYSTRYGGEAPSADPLSQAQQIPEIPEPPSIPAPQNMDANQNHSWAAMRAQMNAARRMAEDFRTKYNQLLESSQKFQEEKVNFGEAMNKKDEEIKALQDEIGRTDLTKSPAFREKYDTPVYQVCDEISKTLMANGYEQQQADDFARQVIQASREELPNMLSELPSYVQGLIMVNADRADHLLADREQALENWRQSAEGLAAVEARGSAVVNAQKVAGYVGKALDIIHEMPVGNGKPPAYQVDEPTFVADRDAKENQFRAWAQNAPMEQLYAAALEGFMAPKTYEMLDQVMKENQELRQALAGRARVAPPITPAPATSVWGQPPPPPPPPTPTVKTAGFEEVPEAELSPSKAFMQQALASMFGGQQR